MAFLFPEDYESWTYKLVMCYKKGELINGEYMSDKSEIHSKIIKELSEFISAKYTAELHIDENHHFTFTFSSEPLEIKISKEVFLLKSGG